VTLTEIQGGNRPQTSQIVEEFSPEVQKCFCYVPELILKFQLELAGAYFLEINRSNAKHLQQQLNLMSSSSPVGLKVVTFKFRMLSGVCLPHLTFKSQVTDVVN